MSNESVPKQTGDLAPRTKVDIYDWIERAKHDPLKYLERQATEIIISAFGKPPFYGKTYLKGGVLMGIAYGSPRQTGDLDVTTSIPAEDIDLEGFSDSFDEILKTTRLELGYLDFELRVQSVKPRPRPDKFTTGSFPALDFTVGFAKHDTPEFDRLKSKRATNIVRVEISFNEPVLSWQFLQLGESETTILAYSLNDLVAEKIRAFLQQEIRKRVRRQDIYDVAMLIKKFDLDEHEREKIHAVLLKKCASRGIEPDIDSIDNPKLIERAEREWSTIQLEIEEDLPSFSTQFEIVREFYRSLPWESD